MEFARRLALGTVQFGQPYGVANRTGQVTPAEAAEIMDLAVQAGIDTLDTAMVYGDSERRLGEIGVARWHVVSKLASVPPGTPNLSAWVREAVAGSLARLRVPRLGALLLHRSAQLLEPEGDRLYRELLALKDEGRVGQIGVSIYGVEELAALWPRFRFDLVQAPFNVVDRRLATSGWLSRLKQAGVEVHVRSVFLQGLLLMDPAERPGRFARWQPLWRQWQDWLAQGPRTPLQACLGFALSQPEIDRVVLGVDRRDHLAEILACGPEISAVPPATLASEDPELVNPSRWKAA